MRVFWIIAKVLKYLKNIDQMADSDDPEAVPMVGHQGNANSLCTISYKTEGSGPGGGETVGSSG